MFTLFGKSSFSDQSNDQNVSLLNMPDVVMREILTKCDLTSILKLMRVCRALHNFIYRSPPVAIAVILKVLVGNDAVFIRFQHSQPDSQYSVKFIILSFHYHKNGCLIVSADDTEKYVKDEDFLSVACDYLRFYLRWVGTIIQFEIEHKDDWFGWKPRFSLGETLKSSISAFIKPSFQLPTFEEIRTTIWETIEECLQSRICPLRVRELILAIEDNRIHILNLLDPKALREIEIEGSGKYPEFDVKRLKNLERLSIKKLGDNEKLCVSNPIRDFFHIKFVDLSVETISDEEILEIKKEFMVSKRLKKMSIHVTQGETRNQLLRLFGPPQHPWNPLNWCFPVNPKGYVICQVSDSTMTFSFEQKLQ